ncbi:DUF4156 domain-containing protein [Vibrio sp. 10N]|uniref:DUF4156 domain-containing protein n=1 Tax=Vibrio sp. 10N TaxID=3058938 RepID=UPI0028139AEA|nr:DUF4156 domain-containing protein [Vibrio sp. 10N]
MLHFKRTLGLWAAIALLLSGCAQPFNQLQSEQAAQVEMRLDASVDVSDCEWKGDVTGSEGYWYTYLFFKNDSLTQGAVNGIKNHAAALGGDTVLLLSPVYFSTSVTLFGSAYRCKK